MKRRVIAAVVVGLVFFTACTGTENAARRARNATLSTGEVKNGNFVAGGGGWLLAGVEVGAGCNASGGDPSLGAWKKNALSFGYKKSTVTQSVIIPNPSTVVLKIDGTVRDDQRDSTFVIDLKSMTQSVSTGTQTGSVLVTPQTFTLTVNTSSTNEAVTISATGSSSKLWAGCYGPMLSNASITVTPSASPIVIVTPTTTIAVAPSTTMPAPTPTTTPSSVAPVTTPTTSPAKVSTTTTPPATTTTTLSPATTIAKVQSNAAYAVPACVVTDNANCSETFWLPRDTGKLGKAGKEITGLNFSGAEMKGLEFVGVKYPGVDFHQADLTDARAIGASFVKGNFVDAKLVDFVAGTLFQDKILSALLPGQPPVKFSADFSGADFSYAQMSGAKLQGTILKGAVFTGADLSLANLLGANLDGADLRYADLTGIRSGLIVGRPLLPRDWSVESGYLVGPGADLSVPNAEKYLEADRSAVENGKFRQGEAGAKCPVVWAKGSTAAFGSGVPGFGALEMKSFDNRDLTGVNFTGLNLRGSSFKSSKLEGALFSGANLDNVDFSEANMSRVSFDYATLNKTIFTRAEWQDISSGCTTALDAASTSTFPKGWKLDSTVFVADGGELYQGKIYRERVYIRRGFILGETANLANANLTGLNFKGVDLSNATLSGVRTASIGKFHIIPPLDTPRMTKLPRDWQMVRGMLIGPGANLEFANLTNVDLRSVDLFNVNLTGAFATTGFRFSGRMPQGLAVAGGRLVGPGADLSNARLGSADFSGVNLTGATLSSVDLSQAKMTGSMGAKIVSDGRERLPKDWRILRGILLGPTANLDGVTQDFSYSDGKAMSFTGIDLREASLNSVEIKGITGNPQLPPKWKIVEGFLVGPTAFVKYSKIKDTSAITQENLPPGYKKVGNTVVGPNITISNFKPKELSDIDLSGSSFENSDFTSTRMNNVRGVNTSFSENRIPREWRYVITPNVSFLAGPTANLSGLDLSNSNLSDVDLRDADLSGAQGRFVTVNDRTRLPDSWKVIAGILFGPTANLSNANLSGLDLSGLDLSQATLDGARGTNIRKAPRELPDGWKVFEENLVGPTANLICASLKRSDVMFRLGRTARMSAELNPDLFGERVPKHMSC